VILSDRDIAAKIKAGDIIIESEDKAWEGNIGASSLDLRLGKYFKVYKHSNVAVLDPKKMGEQQDELCELIEVADGKPFIVQPGEFVLGVTFEKVTLPNDIVARVEGRSSLGRLGIVVHSTAGFIDAGFSGTITLEIANINRLPVALYPGQRICQLAFEPMTSPAEVPYGAKGTQKYQGQIAPQESKIHQDPFFQS
jgi:dCTP deaminase